MGAIPPSHKTDDSFEMISELVAEPAKILAKEHATHRLSEPVPRDQLLDRAHTMLMQHARLVPVSIMTSWKQHSSLAAISLET
jgi:hypothetical protein